MAGTKKSVIQSITAPKIILVRPQLGQNIGMAARAMLNCGFSELRLVAPRDGWPNEDALSASSGAIDVINNAKIYESTADAVAGLDTVFATTARPRRLIKPVISPEEFPKVLETPKKSGILFGPEKAGLTNEDINLSDALLCFELNPGFQSLNLSQAVLLVCYSYWSQIDKSQVAYDPREVFSADQSKSDLATKQSLDNFYSRLESKLKITGFLKPPEKAERMMRNIRSLFNRARLYEHEVQSLHGIIHSLSKTDPKEFDKPE